MKISHRCAVTWGICLYLAVCFSGLGQDAKPAPKIDDEAFESAKAMLTAAYEAEDATSAGHLGEAALAELESVSEETRKQAEFYVFQGFVFDFLGKEDEALKAFAEAQKRNPDDPRPISMQAQIHLDAGRAEAAVGLYASVVKLDSENAEAHYELGVAYHEAGELEKAEKTMLKSLELDPGLSWARRELATIYASLDRDAEAIPIWKDFQKAAPDDLDAHWNLAQSYQLTGQQEDAEREFLSYREKDPEYWRGIEKLVQVSEALGKNEQRDRYMKQLYDLHASEDSPEILQERGFYIRDQFEVEDLKVVAIEYFKLQGERAIKYSFRANRPRSGEEDEFVNRISLGSYETTNQIAKELGELAEGKRRYHLDMYPPDGSHATLGFFEGNPGYEVAKKLAIKGFRGSLEPLSSSGPSGVIKLRPDLKKALEEKEKEN